MKKTDRRSARDGIEARTASKLKHKPITQVPDSGRVEGGGELPRENVPAPRVYWDDAELAAVGNGLDHARNWEAGDVQDDLIDVDCAHLTIADVSSRDVEWPGDHDEPAM